MNVPPEVRIANRVVERFNLSPPVDVRELIKKYADLEYSLIPIIGVDGVCLNLKVPGKRAKVIINTTNPPARRRFTEAHELGHILIPWHMGSIVDHLDPEQTATQDDYWLFEQQANNFAAELLMPSAWVDTLLENNLNLAECHKAITLNCEVSALAASRRLAERLPKGIVFISEKSGEVEFSGRTEGTLAKVPAWGDSFPVSPFSYAQQHFVSICEGRNLHWWKLPADISVASSDTRPWREVLDGIVVDINIPATDRQKFKMSVNGVLANANSNVRRSGSSSVSAIVAACMQRFHDRPEFASFVSHPDFQTFTLKRAQELAR